MSCDSVSRVWSKSLTCYYPDDRREFVTSLFRVPGKTSQPWPWLSSRRGSFDAAEAARANGPRRRTTRAVGKTRSRDPSRRETRAGGHGEGSGSRRVDRQGTRACRCRASAEISARRRQTPRPLRASFSSTRRGSAKIPKRHRERASPLASARSRVGGARQRVVTILAISRSTRVADLRAS
jgi:hypothetical protein